ncbi:hypothetical protein [Porphyromonas sp.]
MKKLFTLLLLGILLWGTPALAETRSAVIVGAERMELLLPTLKGKRVALMVNQRLLIGIICTPDLSSFIVKISSYSPF